MSDAYTSASITQMDDIEHARAKPGHSLGGDPYTTAVRELVDNAFDEAHGGHATRVKIVLRADESVEVIDNGRGIPIDFDDKVQDNGIVKSLGRGKSGSKFDGEGTAGTHGIGAAATNAVSDRFDVTVWRGGKMYHQAFRHGRPGTFAGDGFDPTLPFTRKEHEKLRGTKSGVDKEFSGTSVRLVLDKSIARDSELDMTEVLLRAQSAARMFDGLRLDVVNDGWPQPVPEKLIGTFEGPYGVTALAEFTLDFYETVAAHPIVLEGKSTFTTRFGDSPFTWRTAMSESDKGRVWGFVNNVYTPDGKQHVTAISKGIGTGLAERASRLRTLGLNKGEEPPTADDFAAICTGVIDVTAPNVNFDSQAKKRIDSPSLGRSLARSAQTQAELWAASTSNAGTLLAWAKSALAYARLRRNIEGARKRAQSSRASSAQGENLSLPPGLSPSRRSGRGSGAQLYVCEGDSAALTVQSARDSMFQAAFALRGKPINAYGTPLHKARKNTEFAALEQILGAGVGANCDPERCRYDAVVITADADTDGDHISSLLASNFLAHFRPLVEAGLIFKACPPLFVILHTVPRGQEPLTLAGLFPDDPTPEELAAAGATARGVSVAPDDGTGTQRIYAINDGDRDDVLERLRELYGERYKPTIQRNKGLGEMNPDDFWNTVLDPMRRTLVQLTVTDIERTLALQDTLYGPSPEARRQWLAMTSATAEDFDPADE